MASGSIPLFWRLKKSKYNLIGTKCVTCDYKYFPPKTLCPTCRSKGSLEEFKFSGNGEIVSFTIINTPPEGFEACAPYAVGLVRLEEGATISGQISGDLSNVEIGKKVKSIFRKISEDGPAGVINYGIKFELLG